MITARRGDSRGEAPDTLQSGRCLLAVRRAEQAASAFAQSVALYHALGIEDREATALNCLGMVTDALGDLDAAIGYHEQALALLWEARPAGEAATLDVIGIAQRRRGDFMAAQEAHEHALRIAAAAATGLARRVAGTRSPCFTGDGGYRARADVYGGRCAAPVHRRPGG